VKSCVDTRRLMQSGDSIVLANIAAAFGEGCISGWKHRTMSYCTILGLEGIKTLHSSRLQMHPPF
jgi:hypothetical protein